MEKSKYSYSEFFQKVVKIAIVPAKKMYNNRLYLINMLHKIIKLIYSNESLKSNQKLIMLFRMFLDVVTLHYLPKIKLVVLLYIVFGYFGFTFDLVWDFMPVIGMLDDYALLLYTMKVLSDDINKYVEYINENPEWAEKSLFAKLSKKDFKTKKSDFDEIKENNDDPFDEQIIVNYYESVRDTEVIDLNKIGNEVVLIDQNIKYDQENKMYHETINFLKLNQEDILNIIVLIIFNNNYEPVLINKKKIKNYIFDIKYVSDELINLTLLNLPKLIIENDFSGLKVLCLLKSKKSFEYEVQTIEQMNLSFYDKISSSNLIENKFNKLIAKNYEIKFDEMNFDFKTLLYICNYINLNKKINRSNKVSVYKFIINDLLSEKYYITFDLYNKSVLIYSGNMKRYFFLDELSQVVEKYCFKK